MAAFNTSQNAKIAAAELGMSEKTLRRWLRDNNIVMRQQKDIIEVKMDELRNLQISDILFFADKTPAQIRSSYKRAELKLGIKLMYKRAYGGTNIRRIQ